MDGEGSLARLAGAALIDVVGEQQVEGLDKVGGIQRVPVLELVAPQMEPLLGRPCIQMQSSFGNIKSLSELACWCNFCG